MTMKSEAKKLKKMMRQKEEQIEIEDDADHFQEKYRQFIKLSINEMLKDQTDADFLQELVLSFHTERMVNNNMKGGKE